MNAILLYPEFSSFSFYNHKDVCKITGAKAPESPLGLITMAALLPEAKASGLALEVGWISSKSEHPPAPELA